MTEGYTVKKIDKYDREAFVIVATSEKYAKEILKSLERLQFQDVCYVNYLDLMLLDNMSEYFLTEQEGAVRL